MHLAEAMQVCSMAGVLTSQKGSTMRSRRQGLSRWKKVALASVALIAVAAPIRAFATTNAESLSSDLLATPMTGEDAVRALGTRVGNAATRNGVTADRLRADLRGDRQVWLDRKGRQFVIEATSPEQMAEIATQNAGAVTAPATAAAAPAPLASTFLLHSRPSAKHIIFLDFDGMTVTNTAWNQSYGASLVAAPWDLDNSPSTFSDPEKTTIQLIWQHIAADYAPFDVDVTTEDLGLDRLNRTSTSDDFYGTRALITPSAPISCGCAGIAYVGTFDQVGSSSYQPAWAFVNGFASNAEQVGLVVSHEVGHNLGLSHDGTATASYYQGQGIWSPIMGSSWRPLATWSNGEYAGGTNLEDDVAIIGSNGASNLADDFGNNAASATAINVGTPVAGIIANRADVDAFRFTTTGGATTISATTADPGGDVDLQLTLINSSGTTVATANPTTTVASTNSYATTGLNATITQTLAAGTYAILVEGVGQGDYRVDGYSDYGSIGAYALGVSGATTPPTNQAPTARAAATPSSGQAPLSVTLASAGSTDADGTIASYAWNLGNGTTSTLANPSAVYSAAGTYTATLTVTDNGGATASATATITVTAAPPTNQVPTARAAATPATGVAPLNVTFSSAGSTDADGTIASYAWNFGNGQTSTLANPSAVFSTAGTYSARLTVTDNAGATAAAAVTVTVTAPPVGPCDTYEPNDTAAAAKVFAVGTTQQHTFCTAADQDWSKVTLTAGSATVIETSNLAAGNDTIVYLLDANGAQLAVDDDGGNATNGQLSSKLTYTPTTSGAYLVKVVRYGASGPAGRYDLRISTVAPPTTTGCDAYESDDTAATAKAITIGTGQQHVLCTGNDQDWMKVTLTAGSKYTIETLGLAAGNDTVEYVYSSNGTTQVAVDDDGGNATNGQLSSKLTYTAPATGTYFVKVIRYGSGNPAGAYTVRVLAI
jgi:PKD repeat protein